MLDLRVYRAAFLPSVLALVIVAFSFGTGERGLSTTLASDAFNAERAFAELTQLSRSYPERRPGGAGEEAIARRVADTFQATGFRVRERSFTGRTIAGRQDLTTVIGVRPGNVSSRRVVVIAHRDAADPFSTASLSGTAALLELARVYEGRAVRKTLVLVSTSGGSGGNAGAAEFAADPGGPVEGAIVLGDLAGAQTRSPQTVPWSLTEGIGSQELQRTIETAVREEGGLRPRQSSWAAQWARLAVPLTSSEQGPVDAAGLPAALLSVSGEPGPGAEQRVDLGRLERYGRAALRSITALDNRRAGPPLRSRESIAGGRNILPGWAITLLTGTLLLPVLVAAVDGYARANRRRQPTGQWLAWALSSAVPFLLAAGLAFLLVVLGGIPAPPAPVLGGTIPIDALGVISLVLVLAVLTVTWLWGRPWLARVAGLPFPHASPGDSAGAAAALAVVLAAVGQLTWLVNAFAAALLLPALHLWLLVAAPEVRLRRPFAVVLVLVGLIPGVLLLVYYASRFQWGVLDVPWNLFLVVSGGEISILSLLGWSLLLGAFGCVLTIARRSQTPISEAEPAVTRGPAGYAGPGSLGGTKSALRR